MVNKQKLHDDLTDAFIQYQYRLDNPMPSPTETKEVMILKYRTDPVFSYKVKSVVAGVMRIADKHT
jgi:hypothetical protein